MPNSFAQKTVHWKVWAYFCNTAKVEWQIIQLYLYSLAECFLKPFITLLIRLFWSCFVDYSIYSKDFFLKIFWHPHHRHGRWHERCKRCSCKILELGENLDFDCELFCQKYAVCHGFAQFFSNIVLEKEEFIMKNGLKMVRKGLLLDTKEDLG